MKLFTSLLICICISSISFTQGKSAKALSKDHPLIGAWMLDESKHPGMEDFEIISESIDSNKFKAHFEDAWLPDSIIVSCRYLLFHPEDTPSTISYMEMDGYFMVALTFKTLVDKRTIYGESLDCEAVIMSGMHYPFSFGYKLKEDNNLLEISVRGSKFYFVRYKE